ncbi:MAG: MFS transporter [Chloroflexota bacterium]
MTASRSSPFFYGYAIVAAVFINMVVFWGTYYSFGVLLKPMAAELNLSREVTTLAPALGSFIFGFFTIVAGRLTDRFGPRLTVSVCGLLVGAGYLLLARAGTAWQLYLFYGLFIGVGMGGSFFPLLSTVARWFVKRRGIMTGIAGAGIGFGILVFPAMAGWLVSGYGWRPAFAAMGVACLVLVILPAQFLRRDPGRSGLLAYGLTPAAHPDGNLQLIGLSFREAVRTRQFWLTSGFFFCGGFIIFTILVHITPHATDLGIPVTTAASFLSVIGVLSIAGRVVIGAASDRLGHKTALIICFAPMAAVLFWVTTAREVWMLYLFAVIFGFTYGGFSALEQPVIAELFGLRSLGLLSGFIGWAFTIGGAVGPWLGGRIFDTAGSYQTAFLACGAVSALGLVLVALLRPLPPMSLNQ